MVEEARLESVYMPKVYHGFESRSLRKKKLQRPKGRHRKNPPPQACLEGGDFLSVVIGLPAQ